MTTIVELGQVCDECGGSGRLPDRECRMCFGDGTTSRFLTLAEFREVVAAPTAGGHGAVAS